MQANLPTERRLYQKIADRIRDFIFQGDFEVGSRLPPERDLTQLLGVSRPSLREALIALEIEGCVEIRMGSGVYIKSKSLQESKKTSGLGESPSELMRARALIEGETILLACLYGKKSDLRYLRSCVESMRQCVSSGQAPVEADRKFHHHLAKMSGNSALVRIITALFDERHSPISALLSEHAENFKTWNQAILEHEAILSALEAKDIIGAQTRMREHLHHSESRWLGTLGASESLI